MGLKEQIINTSENKIKRFLSLMREWMNRTQHKMFHKNFGCIYKDGMTTGASVPACRCSFLTQVLYIPKTLKKRFHKLTEKQTIKHEILRLY